MSASSVPQRTTPSDALISTASKLGLPDRRHLSCPRNQERSSLATVAAALRHPLSLETSDMRSDSRLRLTDFELLQRAFCPETSSLGDPRNRAVRTNWEYVNRQRSRDRAECQEKRPLHRESPAPATMAPTTGPSFAPWRHVTFRAWSGTDAAPEPSHLRVL